MGNRLTRIVTRTGDDGTTGLAHNQRVRKDHPRIEAMGEIDELNSHIGLLLAENLPSAPGELLRKIQHQLFDLGGELALPSFTGINEEKILALEQAVVEFNQDLPPLKEFILPGGTRPAALAHVSRTVCRRAERRLVALAASEPVSPLVIKYLNRLSDLLFVLARTLNTGGEPEQWQKTK